MPPRARDEVEADRRRLQRWRHEALHLLVWCVHAARTPAQHGVQPARQMRHGARTRSVCQRDTPVCAQLLGRASVGQAFCAAATCAMLPALRSLPWQGAHAYSGLPVSAPVSACTHAPAVLFLWQAEAPRSLPSTSGQRRLLRRPRLKRVPAARAPRARHTRLLRLALRHCCLSRVWPAWRGLCRLSRRCRLVILS